MLIKGVLLATALAFIGCGLLSFFWPIVISGYIGYGLTNADSKIEMVAMYGGLEIGLGLFYLLGALKKAYSKGSLILIIMTVGGLTIGRLFAFAVNSDPVTSYTYGAIFYESITCVLAFIALSKIK